MPLKHGRMCVSVTIVRTMKNKIVLITGSTQGIGLATARRLYEEGASVIINSPLVEDGTILEQFEDKNRVRFFAADISNEASLLDLKNFIVAEFGKLDYLVANAGILPTPSGIDDITNENIDSTIDINLKGTFRTLRIFGNLIQETSQSGSIVTLTSVDGVIGEPYGVIYSATKAGIISLTKSFARKLNAPLVRINAVAPGLIDTPLSSSTGENPSDTTDVSIIKRIGKPEEIAAAITFLLSDDASFITGQVLAVDGGFTLK
jgi:3-oxoacyl-[acyl-carrier protein] reductase